MFEYSISLLCKNLTLIYVTRVTVCTGMRAWEYHLFLFFLFDTIVPGAALQAGRQVDAHDTEAEASIIIKVIINVVIRQHYETFNWRESMLLSMPKNIYSL